MEAKRDAYQDLYKSHNGTAGWIDTLPPEPKEWLEGLADHIKTRGEPVWASAHKRFCELFPDNAPKSPGTISSTVRKLNGG
jgi:hypothetical protein